MPNPKTPFRIVEIHTNRPASGMRQAANDILIRDFQAGKLDEVVMASVSEPGEVATLLKGMEMGMAYGFALIASGKINLQIIKIENPG